MSLQVDLLLVDLEDALLRVDDLIAGHPRCGLSEGSQLGSGVHLDEVEKNLFANILEAPLEVHLRVFDHLYQRTRKSGVVDKVFELCGDLRREVFSIGYCKELELVAFLVKVIEILFDGFEKLAINIILAKAIGNEHNSNILRQLIALD